MAYSTEVLADSPWLYWGLDDTSGSTAADSSGNARTGTFGFSPTLVQSPLVNANFSMDFPVVGQTPGDGSAYILSTSATFNNSVCTVECWYAYDGSPPSAGNLWFVAGCVQGEAGGTADKDIYIDENGKAVFYVYDGAVQLAVGATTLTAGIYHLVGRYDGTNATIWVNGAQDGTVTAASTFTGYGSANVLVAGRSNVTGVQRHTGRRDEFALYTTALSAARIQTHFDAGISRAPIAAEFPARHFGPF